MKKFSQLLEQDLEGKKVAVRIDVNSPVVAGEIQDNPRFHQHKETISSLLKKNASVVLLAHQGRPGKPDHTTLKKHAELLSKRMHKKVKFVDDFLGAKAAKALSTLGKRKILLLENTRFLSEEMLEESQAETLMAKQLAKHCHYFVNDALSVCHRKQTSVTGLPLLLDSYPGPALEREAAALDKLGNSMECPAVFVLGGAKTREAISVAESCLAKNATVLAGGVFGELVLLAQGKDLGLKTAWLNKEYSQDLEKVKQLLAKHEKQVFAPVDAAFEDDEGFRVEVPIEHLPKANRHSYDIGSKTAKAFADVIKDAKTVCMKGPMGAIEKPSFQLGTRTILKAMLDSPAFTAIAGGHTGFSLEALGFSAKKFGFVSTSGGAFLEGLSGKKLPGVEALHAQEKTKGETK